MGDPKIVSLKVPLVAGRPDGEKFPLIAVDALLQERQRLHALVTAHGEPPDALTTMALYSLTIAALLSRIENLEKEAGKI